LAFIIYYKSKVKNVSAKSLIKAKIVIYFYFN